MGIVELKGYECERCKHTWLPRSKINELPIICPKCKSPYWNKPRNPNIPKKTKLKKEKIR